GNAVGLNGCRVTGATVSPERVDLALERLGPTHPMHRRPLEQAQSGGIVLRAHGLSHPRVRVTINGADLGEVDRKAVLAGLEIPPSHPRP
ncbi:MAG: hypothetical protein Q8R92_13755, partial [Deltaproteobacteria bacterium]|nr:hypothetical protein [Deltaproteobacteria bacterium]